MGKRFISDYFGFNRQQRNGLWVLVLLSFLLLMLRIIYPYFIQPAPMVIEDLPLLERRLDSAGTAVSLTYRNGSRAAQEKEALFSFDPNTVSKEQLHRLGFDPKTSAVFLKFRSKGMVFREKKDLLKVYGISDALYTRIAPYVAIRTPSAVLRVTSLVRQPASPVVSSLAASLVELNTADSTQLVALNGIGPGYSARILKYRSLLGGYASVEQLKEVYGFTNPLFERVKQLFTADAQLIKKINLNKDSFKMINRHPYLSYELTKIIFDWRRKTIINATNLKDMLRDEALYRKLLPYLVFD